MDYQVSESQSVSLTERVYGDLRRAVITGRMAEGTRIVESVLAEKMGVSRTPVREALQKLTSEGLLHCIPKVGYVISEMSDRDIEDLFRTRAAIEQIAGRWSLDGITENELHRLLKNLESTAEVLSSGQTRKMINLDIEFHGIIYRASRSKTLNQITQSLSDRTLKYRMACIHLPHIAARAREGHCQIYKAMVARSSERLDEAILNHLEFSKKDILEYLERLRQESFVEKTSLLSSYE